MPMVQPNVFSNAEWVFDSERSLFTAISNYILKEFVIDDERLTGKHQNFYDDKQVIMKLVKELFNNCNRRLRMYGSAEEFMTNLQILRNSPNIKSTQVFFDPWTHSTTIYKSMKGDQYICKQDIYVIIQNFVLNKFDTLALSLAGFSISLCMRTYYTKLEYYDEYVKYDEDEIKTLGITIYQTIRRLLETYISDISPNFKTNNSVEENASQWVELIPLDFDKTVLWAMAKEYFEKCPLEKNYGFWWKMIKSLKIAVETVDKTINNLPAWFNSTSKKCLRVFEDNDHKFVMVNDVFTVGGVELLNKLSTQYFKSNGVSQSSGLHTFKFNDFKNAFGEEIHEIEFIRSPIIRTKHVAVPIYIKGGGRCILAVDLLFEVVRQLIFGQKIFQRSQNNQNRADRVSNFLEKLITDHFSVLKIHFVEYESAKKIKRDIVESLKWNRRDQAKDVRNAKVDGFTLQNLINELKNLDLEAEFPDITKYAEVSYNEVVKNKKENVLRTCDLFDAIEHCQLICILKKFPKLATFVHSHNACYRILEPCRICIQKALFKKYKLEDVTMENDSTMRLAKMDCEKMVYLDQKMNLPDGDSLMSNFVFNCMGSLANQKNRNNGKITEDEFKRCNSMWNNSQFVLLKAIHLPKFKEYIDGQYTTLHRYKNLKPHGKVYLRLFSSTVFNKDNNMRAFTSDVEEIIKHASPLKKMENDKYNELLLKYQTEWDVEQTGFPQNCKSYRTISSGEAENAFRAFEIYDQHVTLVPDIGYAMSVFYKMPLDLGESIIKIRSPKLFYLVQDKNQAILQMFQSTIAVVDFEFVCEENHPNCMEDYKDSALRFMEEISNYPDMWYFPNDLTLKMIETLRKHCFYKSQDARGRVIDKYYTSHFNTTINVLEFVQDCKKLHLNVFEVPSSCQTINKMKQMFIPIWKARYIIMLELIENFFDEKTAKVKEYALEGLAFKAPFHNWQNQNELTDSLWCLTDSEWPWNDALQFSRPCDINKLEEHELMHSNKIGQQKFIEQGSSNEKIREIECAAMQFLYTWKMKEKNDEESVAIVSTKKTKKKNKKENIPVSPEHEVVVEPETEIKTVIEEKVKVETIDRAVSPIPFECDQCLKNKTILEKTNETLKCELEAILPLKEKATEGDHQIEEIKKRTEEDRLLQELMKKDCMEKDKIIKNLEKKLPAQQKELKELEKLKLEIAKRQDGLDDLRSEFERQKTSSQESESIFNTERLGLQKSIRSKKEFVKVLDSKLVNRLAEEHLTDVNDLDSILNRQLQIEAEIEKKRRESHELREESRTLERLNEEKEDLYNQLLDELHSTFPVNQPSTSSAPSYPDYGQSTSSVFQNQFPPIPSYSVSSEPSTSRPLLAVLLEKRTRILNENPFKQAEDLANRLITACNDETIKDDAIYEIIRFQKDYNTYMKTLEYNINNLQSNSENSTINLTPFPKFSDEFCRNYLKVFNELFFMTAF